VKQARGADGLPQTSLQGQRGFARPARRNARGGGGGGTPIGWRAGSFLPGNRRRAGFHCRSAATRPNAGAVIGPISFCKKLRRRHGPNTCLPWPRRAYCAAAQGRPKNSKTGMDSVKHRPLQPNARPGDLRIIQHRQSARHAGTIGEAETRKRRDTPCGRKTRGRTPTARRPALISSWSSSPSVPNQQVLRRPQPCPQRTARIIHPGMSRGPTKNHQRGRHPQRPKARRTSGACDEDKPVPRSSISASQGHRPKKDDRENCYAVRPTRRHAELH